MIAGMQESEYVALNDVQRYWHGISVQAMLAAKAVHHSREKHAQTDANNFRSRAAYRDFIRFNKAKVVELAERCERVMGCKP